MKMQTFDDCQKMEDLLEGRINSCDIADAYGIPNPEESELLQKLVASTSQVERRDLFMSANGGSRVELLIFNSLVDNATTQDERWKLYTDTAVTVEQENVILVEILNHTETMDERWQALKKAVHTIGDEPNSLQCLVLRNILAKTETQADRMKVWAAVNEESDIARIALNDILNNAKSEPRLWELFNHDEVPPGIRRYIIRILCNTQREN